MYRTSLAGATDYYAQFSELGFTNRTKDKYITSTGMDLWEKTKEKREEKDEKRQRA